MSRARISRAIDPKTAYAVQCRGCGNWFDSSTWPSALWCRACSQKRQERFSAHHERVVEDHVSGAKSGNTSDQSWCEERGIDWRAETQAVDEEPYFD